MGRKLIFGCLQPVPICTFMYQLMGMFICSPFHNLRGLTAFLAAQEISPSLQNYF